MHWHIQKYGKFPKHWWEICIPVFISKTDAQKQKRDLSKHKNNKLCSHSWFTYQKCNPIRWIDCQLSPKPLWRLNRINTRYFANSKFTSVGSTIPRHSIWGLVLKRITSNRKCCWENSSSVRKSQFFEQGTRIQKWVYQTSKACHTLYKSIKHQSSGNVEQNSSFKSKVTNNIEKSYRIESFLTSSLTSSQLERFFSFMGNIKRDWRCELKKETVEALARITIEGPDLKEWTAVQASNAIEHWYKLQNWAIKKKTVQKTSVW